MANDQNSASANGSSNPQRLLKFLSERGKDLSPMLILTHDFPDPDALASAFALQHLAQNHFEITAHIAYGGEIGRVENKTMVRLLKIPARKIQPGWFHHYSSVALVDTQPGFANNSFPRKWRASLVIDQHSSTSPPEADLALIDPNCGATCVVIAQALLDKNDDIPARIATALAYGILTDTLDLYRARSQGVVQTYLRVLQHCDMRCLARIQNPVRPRQFFSSLGRGIVGAVRYRRLLVAHLGVVDNPDSVSQVADFLLVYRRILWCLVTGRYKGKLHASLRTSRTDVEAGDVLRDAFDNPREAGGHGSIAGGSTRIGIEAPEDEWVAKEKTLQTRLLKRLRISATTEPRRPFAK